MSERYDVAIVGAGIVGLAHALAAARKGLRAIVVDRDRSANGASIRNFGFITVTGQPAGIVWQRARRSRDLWCELAAEANVPIVHRNECLVAHSHEALAVLEQFLTTEMGDGCELLTPDAVQERVPMARREEVTGALWSPHDVRIEPRSAIPALGLYLENRFGVTIRRGVHARAVNAPQLETSGGAILAERVVVAPGPDLATLFPEVYARHGVRLCKLHMLRLAPQPGDWRLPAAMMSDFGLVRYGGFSAQPAAPALRALLAEQYPEILAAGIHLIAVQSADGSLVIGDSHEYSDAPDPFFSSIIENGILELAHSVLHIPNVAVTERWIGIYPQSELCEWFVEAPDARTRVVAVTAGNGMSTAFALAEEVIAEFAGSGV
ncbi:MAG: TIGR03364 family FAD-dependent oxidoreductase [Candidatus Eremiobacteraeota bacterium]|nr:TIGR03364 family FAD-dependent oxidoreductase [Candidatus Eremiobacteraeota bacterium]